MKNLLKKSKFLVVAVILLSSVFYSCSNKVWQPVTNPIKTTSNLECGEEQILYTNSSNKMEMLIFKFNNKCEFSAYAWASDSDTLMKAATHITIPGRRSVQTSYDLNPGDSFNALCSMVSTIANEGCEVTYWVAATK